jgi:hypothetical protein
MARRPELAWPIDLRTSTGVAFFSDLRLCDGLGGGSHVALEVSLFLVFAIASFLYAARCLQRQE